MLSNSQKRKKTVTEYCDESEEPFVSQNFGKEVYEDGIHPYHQEWKNPGLLLFHIDQQ